MTCILLFKSYYYFLKSRSFIFSANLASFCLIISIRSLLFFKSCTTISYFVNFWMYSWYSYLFSLNFSYSCNFFIRRPSIYLKSLKILISFLPIPPVKVPGSKTSPSKVTHLQVKILLLLKAIYFAMLAFSHTMKSPNANFIALTTD